MVNDSWDAELVSDGKCSRSSLYNYKVTRCSTFGLSRQSVSTSTPQISSSVLPRFMLQYLDHASASKYTTSTTLCSEVD